MEKKFNREIYLNYLKDGFPQKAYDYKNECVPNTLFKFIGLDNEFDLSNKKINYFVKLNAKKIECLKRSRLWLSTYSQLNDPFEFNSMYVDQNDSDTDLKTIKERISDLRESRLICSFSNINKRNLPLWAYYGNNHRGYCLQFSVIDKKYIYPVIYEKNKVLVSKSFSDNEIKRDDLLLEYQNYSSAWIHFSFCTKFDRWAHEKEWRLIFASSRESDKWESTSLPWQIVGLKLENIFVGLKCEKVEEICKIAEAIHCNAYQMYVNEKTKEFKLDAKRIYSAS